MSAQQDYNSESEIDSDIEDLLYSQLHYATDAVVDEKSELVNGNVNLDNNLDPGKGSSKALQQQVPEDTNDAWKISEKDLQGAEDYNKSLSNLKRYYKDEPNKGYMCYNCRTRGHLSKDCPKPQRKKTCYLCGEEGHVRKDCPNDVCYNCFEIGHISRFCDEPKKNFYAVCKRCWGRGHNKRTCPEIWRQYHLTVADNGKLDKPKKGKNGMLAHIKETRYCYNCGLEGHFGHDCEQQRQSRRAVSSPFIVYYDKCPYQPIQKESKDKRANEQPVRSPSLEKKNSSKTKDSSRKTRDIENTVDHKKETSREHEIRSSSRHVTIVRERSGQRNTRVTFAEKESEDYYSRKSEERKNDSVGSRMEDDNKSSRKSRNDRGNDNKASNRIVISSDSDRPKSAEKNTSYRDAGTRSKGVEKDRARSSEPKSRMENSEQAKKYEPLMFVDDRSGKKESRASGYVVISSSDNGEDAAMDLQDSRRRQFARDDKRVKNIVLSSDSTDTEVNKPRQVRKSKPIWCSEKEDEVTDRASPRKRKWRTSDEKQEEAPRKKINRNNVKVSVEKHDDRRSGNSGGLVSDVHGPGSTATEAKNPDSRAKEAGVHDNKYTDDFIELDVYESFGDDDKDFATPDNDTKKATFEIPADKTENRKKSGGDKEVEKRNADSFSLRSRKMSDVPKKNGTKDDKAATKKDETDAEYCHIHPERRGFVDSARHGDKESTASVGSENKESDKSGKKRKRIKVVDRRSESGKENAEKKTSGATSSKISSDNNKTSLSTSDKVDRKKEGGRERVEKKKSNASSTKVSSDLDKASLSTPDKLSVHPERQQLISCVDFLDSDANRRSKDASERAKNKSYSASSRNVSSDNDKAAVSTLGRVNIHPERQQLVSSSELPYSDVNRRPENASERATNRSYSASSREVSSVNEKAAVSMLGKVNLHPERQQLASSLDLPYSDVNRRPEDASERAKNKSYSASSRKVSSDNDKAPVSTLGKVNLHPERQQLASSLDLPYSDVNRRPEDASERAKNKSYSASSRKVSSDNDKAHVSTLGKVNLHPERQQLASSLELPYSDVNRRPEDASERAKNKSYSASSRKVSSDNEKAAVSMLGKVNLHPERQQLASSLELPYSDVNRRPEDASERAKNKSYSASSRKVSSDNEKAAVSMLGKVNLHPERQQLASSLELPYSDVNRRPEDASERAKNKSYSASSRKVSSDNEKAAVSMLGKVNLHPERQQRVSSFEFPYSDVNRGNRPGTIDVNHSYIPERNVRSKARLDKETRNPSLGGENMMSADVLYLDVNDRRHDGDTGVVDRDSYSQKEDYRGPETRSRRIQSNQSKITNKRNVYFQTDEDVSDQYHNEDDDVVNLLSTSTESRDLGPGSREKKNKKPSSVFENEDSANEEENFQFSNLLINRDGEVSSDEDDLRYKINTLKATKRRRNNSPERSGPEESEFWNDPDETEGFMFEREAPVYDGYSGDMQEENIVPEEPRKIDFTMYDPNEAYEEDLSYYGVGNTNKYSERYDERFKEPEHIVFVENEDAEDDDDGNKASTKITRRKSKVLPTLKIKRLQNVSKPKEVKSSPFSLPKEIKSNSYLVKRNQAIVERHTALFEDDSSQDDNNQEKVKTKPSSKYDIRDPELKDWLLNEKIENINVRKLHRKLRKKGLECKKQLLEKTTSKGRSKIRLSWKKCILRFFGISPKKSQQKQQQQRHEQQQQRHQQQQQQNQLLPQQQQKSHMTDANDNGDNINVIDLTTPVKNPKVGRNRNRRRRNRAATKNPTNQSKKPSEKRKYDEASPNTSEKKRFVNRKWRNDQNKDRGFKTSDSAKGLLTLGSNYL